MLPSVSNKKRSSSKLSSDLTSSPYFQPFIRASNSKSRSFISKKSSPSAGKFSFYDGLQDPNKTSEIKRLSIDQSLDLKSRFQMKPEDLEKIIQERLERFSIGDSEFSSEMEIFDSVFDEVLAFFKPFDAILNMIRRKIKEECYKYAKEDYLGKIEKVDKENKRLLAKINSLSDINIKLNNEKKEIQEKLQEYERIFKENPNFLINYQNIVNKMLHQCEEIEDLQKDNKRLKKIEECFIRISKDLNDCSTFDIPRFDESFPSTSQVH
jgi:hypothetical protein